MTPFRLHDAVPCSVADTPEPEDSDTEKDEHPLKSHNFSTPSTSVNFTFIIDHNKANDLREGIAKERRLASRGAAGRSSEFEFGVRDFERLAPSIGAGVGRGGSEPGTG